MYLCNMYLCVGRGGEKQMGARPALLGRCCEYVTYSELVLCSSMWPAEEQEQE